MQKMMLGLEKKIQNQGSEIKKTLQDQSSVVKQMGNEIVTLKQQQAQHRPAQTPYQNSSYNRP